LFGKLHYLWSYRLYCLLLLYYPIKIDGVDRVIWIRFSRWSPPSISSILKASWSVKPFQPCDLCLCSFQRMLFFFTIVGQLPAKANLFWRKVILEVPNAVCALCEEQIEISCHMFERCISPFIYYMVFLSITSYHLCYWCP
jgi:hypothetical protein